MRLIDADKFLGYLIYSKHIDSLLCKEVNDAVEMCKVDVFDKIRKEMNDLEKRTIEDVCLDECRPCVYTTFEYVRQIIDKYK